MDEQSVRKRKNQPVDEPDADTVWLLPAGAGAAIEAWCRRLYDEAAREVKVLKA